MDHVGTDAFARRASTQIRIPLESLPQKLKKHIPDERRNHGNFKIGAGKNIFDGPRQTSLLPHARPLKFSHQQIGIKQEDDETHLDHSA
jgi:hypothetical protein